MWVFSLITQRLTPQLIICISQAEAWLILYTAAPSNAIKDKILKLERGLRWNSLFPLTFLHSATRKLRKKSTEGTEYELLFPGEQDKSLKFFGRLRSSLLSSEYFSNLELLKGTHTGLFHFFSLNHKQQSKNQQKHPDKALCKKQKSNFHFQHVDYSSSFPGQAH